MKLTVKVGELELRHGDPRVRAATGCRCVACQRSNGTKPLAPKAARLAADPTLAPHGSLSTYNNWGCRCEPCREANRVHSQQVRDSLKEGGGPIVRAMRQRVQTALATTAAAGDR